MNLSRKRHSVVRLFAGYFMNLGLLVERFGQFVRARHQAYPTAPAADEFPESIARLRACVAHHLVPLALLSKVDGDCVQSERDAIVAHCLSFASQHGLSASDDDRATFGRYVADFRPSLMQLDPALKLVERDSAEDIASLFSAAEAVAAADGKLDPAEKHLLAELKSGVAKLRG